MVVILKKEFTAMLSLESRIMVNYINIVSGKAQFLSGKITFLPLKTIKEKIACYLMQRTSKDVGKDVTIDITQTNLADLFAVNRPSLTHTILEMGKKAIFT